MSGKKKTINKSFWVAKGMVSDSYHTPIRGMPPKTFLRIYEKRTGKDLDVGHCTHNKTDHSHSYKNGKRSKEQNLTKQEKRILKKQKRKGGFLMDLSKYQFKDYIKDFMDDINNHDDEITDFHFSYKNEDYVVNHVDGKFVAYKNVEGSEEFIFSSMDDFFLNFKLDGKPFIEEVNNLDYEEY